MNKKKILIHSKGIGYAGTDRVAQVLCRYLLKSDKYEPFLIYRKDYQIERLEPIKVILGQDHLLEYEWIPGKQGRRPPYWPEYDNFKDVVDKLRPFLVHCHNAGIEEHPIFKCLYPYAKLVRHNIFGMVDPRAEIDQEIYISEFNRKLALKNGGKDGPVLSNPVELPILEPTLENKLQAKNNLLLKYKLPSDSILCGRVGRADNFCDISLRSLKIVEQQRKNIYYLVVNPCQGWRDAVKNLDIQNVIFLDPMFYDNELQMFYLGLDIYCHARSDGECSACNIQEAMMWGALPIISHRSKIYNGQVEMLQDVGYCVGIDDYENYARVLLELIDNPELRAEIGIKARDKALANYEAGLVTKKLEKIYNQILGL